MPTTTEKTFELELIEADYDLTGTACDAGDSSVPDDQDCSNYYRCVHEEWSKKTCAVGLMFDSSTNRCNWANIVDCEGRHGNNNYFVPTGEEVNNIT